MDLKKILWENLKALMIHRLGEENLYRIHKDSGISLGTLYRIKEQKTAVGLDVINRLSIYFDVPPWQFFVPGLNPASLPVLVVTEAEIRLYKCLESFKFLVQEVIKQ